MDLKSHPQLKPADSSRLNAHERNGPKHILRRARSLSPDKTNQFGGRNTTLSPIRRSGSPVRRLQIYEIEQEHARRLNQKKRDIGGQLQLQLSEDQEDPSQPSQSNNTKILGNDTRHNNDNKNPNVNQRPAKRVKFNQDLQYLGDTPTSNTNPLPTTAAETETSSSNHEQNLMDQITSLRTEIKTIKANQYDILEQLHYILTKIS